VEFDPPHEKITPLLLNSCWEKFLLLNIKASPSSLFVTADAAEEGGEEGGNQGDFNWHCKNGLSKNI